MLEKMGTELTAMTMKSVEEGFISKLDWLAAAETIEDKTRQYHCEEQSVPLVAHHGNVMELTQSFDWETAC